MLVRITKDGPKNFSVLVTGVVVADFEIMELFNLDKVTPPREGWKGLRLDSAVWAVQEKMTLLLWWEDAAEEEHLIFPVESRNSIRFEEGLQSPRADEHWSRKLWISGFRVSDPPGEKAFMLALDFDKQ